MRLFLRAHARGQKEEGKGGGLMSAHYNALPIIQHRKLAQIARHTMETVPLSSGETGDDQVSREGGGPVFR